MCIPYDIVRIHTFCGLALDVCGGGMHSGTVFGFFFAKWMFVFVRKRGAMSTTIMLGWKFQISLAFCNKKNYVEQAVIHENEKFKLKKFITNFYTIDTFTFRMESIEHWITLQLINIYNVHNLSGHFSLLKKLP